jgi:hypothetical protein
VLSKQLEFYSINTTQRIPQDKTLSELSAFCGRRPSPIFLITSEDVSRKQKTCTNYITSAWVLRAFRMEHWSQHCWENADSRWSRHVRRMQTRIQTWHNLLGVWLMPSWCDVWRYATLLYMNDALELSTIKPQEYGLFDTFGKPEQECVHALHAGCSLSSFTFCNIADSISCNTRCTTPWNHWNDKITFTRRTRSKHLMKATASSSFTGLPSCSFGAHGVPNFQARHKYAFPFIRCTLHYECAPKL